MVVVITDGFFFCIWSSLYRVFSLYIYSGDGGDSLFLSFIGQKETKREIRGGRESRPRNISGDEKSRTEGKRDSFSSPPSSVC